MCAWFGRIRSRRQLSPSQCEVLGFFFNRLVVKSEESLL